MEVLQRQKESIDASDVLTRLELERGAYIVLSAHREENIDSEKNFQDLVDAINLMAQVYNKRIIISTHPRTRKKLEEKEFEFGKLADFIKPLGFADYIKLQSNAFCVVSDSGTITEESSLLRFPAITIRQAHERPEGMDEGTLIMSGLDPQDIVSAIEIVTRQFVHNPKGPNIVPDYDSECVSQKVVRIIMSYTKYIRRTVWREDV